MAYKSNILIGHITKVSGYEGAVIVKTEKIFSENNLQMESVFLEIEGRLVPFFISYLEYTGTVILKLIFAGYDSIEKISEFIGCRVFSTTVISYDYPEDDIRSLKGYKVLIQDDKLLGSIIEVIQNPGHLLLKVISAENKEILVPFHEHFILSINKRKRIIVMEIPAGLTEIN